MDPSAFRIELDTSSLYIATVNITSIAGYGQWELDFSSNGPYSIKISGLSSLGLSRQFYQLDSDSHFGFSKIEGNPTKGRFILLNR